MSEFGRGYDAGQAGLLKAVKSAELLGALRERERIIELLGEDNYDPEDWFEMRFDHLIALIKGEEE